MKYDTADRGYTELALARKYDTADTGYNALALAGSANHLHSKQV